MTLWVLTDRTQVAPGRTVVDVVAALADGLGPVDLTVVLREKDLARAERRALAVDLLAVLDRGRDVVGLRRLVVASDPALATEVGVAGVHLAGSDPWPTPSTLSVVGRSCHSVAGLQAAAAEGCAYAFVSPVFETPSKPGYGPALGLDGLASAIAGLRAAGVDLPVVALGGIEPETAGACLEAGAAGVATMGSAMRDPARWISAGVAPATAVLGERSGT